MVAAAAAFRGASAGPRGRAGPRRARGGSRGAPGGGAGSSSSSGAPSDAPDAPPGRFRGAWLDPAGRNRGGGPRPRGRRAKGAMTAKNLIAAHGVEEFNFYVAFHVERHQDLGRKIAQWRRDYVTLRGREPQFEDMPERIRRMEEAYLHIGHKLSILD